MQPGNAWRLSFALVSTIVAFRSSVGEKVTNRLFPGYVQTFLRALRRTLPNASWPPSTEDITKTGGALAGVLAIVAVCLLHNSKEQVQLEFFDSIQIKEGLACRTGRLKSIFRCYTQKLRILLTQGRVQKLLLRQERTMKICQLVDEVISMESVEQPPEYLLLRDIFHHDTGKMEDKEDVQKTVKELDTEGLLHACEELSKFQSHHTMSLLGYIAATVGISAEILTKVQLEDSGVRVGQGESIDTILQTFHSMEDQFNKFKLPHNLSRGLKSFVRPELQLATRRMQVRWFRQTRKIVTLLERSKSQLVLWGACAYMSIISGIIHSLRVQVQSNMIDLGSSLVARGSSTRAARSGWMTAATSLLIVELLSILTQLVRQRINILGRANFIRNLKADLFASLMKQDFEYFETHNLWDTRFLIDGCDVMCRYKIAYFAHLIHMR